MRAMLSIDSGFISVGCDTPAATMALASGLLWTAVAMVMYCNGLTINQIQHELASLPPHPRIRVNNTQLQTINNTITSSPFAQDIFANMVVHGDKLVQDPLVECVASGPGQLLLVSRAVLDRTYTLGLLYRLTGNLTYAKRAIAEMLNVSQHPARCFSQQCRMLVE